MPDLGLDLVPISAETAKLAEIELRETPENVKKGIEELRAMIEKNSALFFRTDDQFLIIFLRPCKYYAKSAYELMVRVSEFKKKYKETLADLTPDTARMCFFDSNVVNVLANRDHKGRRVLIVNAGSTWEPSKVNADQLFRMFYLIHEAAMLEPETQVRGAVVIMDFNGMGMTQVKALGPSFSLKLLGFIQDAMPLRLKEVHMVKEPLIFNMVWTIFKPLIRDKLKKRIFFHGKKMSSLHKHMAPSHLPADYDGQLPKIDYCAADWFPVIKTQEEYIKEYNSFGYKNKA